MPRYPTTSELSEIGLGVWGAWRNRRRNRDGALLDYLDSQIPAGQGVGLFSPEGGNGFILATVKRNPAHKNVRAALKAALRSR